MPKTIHKNRSEVYDFIMSLPKANYQKDGLAIQKALRNEWLNRHYSDNKRISINILKVK